MPWIERHLVDDADDVLDNCECSGNDLYKDYLTDLLELNITRENFMGVVELCELLEVTNPDVLFDEIFEKLGFDVVHEFGDYYKNNSKRLKPHDRDSLSRAIKLYCSNKKLACKVYGHSAYWDVFGITDMSDLFKHNPYGKKKKELCEFNGDISRWDVSNVVNMSRMFYCSPFNGDISRWDVSNVKDMSCMFERSDFNGNIKLWNVENVENMSYMFAGSKFNGDLEWNTENVTDMRHFLSNTGYTGNLKLDVSNVIYFTAMFNGTLINGVDDVDLSKWDVRNGQNFDSMFRENPNFNGDVSGWDMKKAVDLTNMFTKCQLFNRNVSEWDLSNVECMYSIFREGPKFSEASPFKNITSSQTEQLKLFQY